MLMQGNALDSRSAPKLISPISRVASADGQGDTTPSTYDSLQAEQLKESYFNQVHRDPAAFRLALEQAFGDKLDPAATNALIDDVLSGKQRMPDLRFVEADSLGDRALAAYDGRDGGTIYLDRSLLDRPDKLKSVFMEEMGHHIDQTLGGPDTQGDEGAIFSRTLLEGRLDNQTLTRFRAENDHGVIQIDGRLISVEFHEADGPGMGADDSSGASDNTSDGPSGGDPGASSGMTDGGSDNNAAAADTSPSNANDNTSDGPNGGDPSASAGMTDASGGHNDSSDNSGPSNANDNTADGPRGGDPGAMADLGMPTGMEGIGYAPNARDNTADGPNGGNPYDAVDTTAPPGFRDPVPENDWNENTVFPGKHGYTHLSPPLGDNYRNLRDALNNAGVHPNQKRAFVPDMPYRANVDLPGLPGVDDISSTAIRDRRGNQIGVRNVTERNHALHPGWVERTIVQQEGQFHVQTIGGGTGWLGGPNVWGDESVWSGVDDRVADALRW